VDVGIATGPLVAPDSRGLWVGDVPAEAATMHFPSDRDLSGHARYVFSVPGPGSFTYYLNAEMVAGQDPNDLFWFANMNAVYYYDPAPAAAPPSPTLATKEEQRERLIVAGSPR